MSKSDDESMRETVYLSYCKLTLFSNNYEGQRNFSAFWLGCMEVILKTQAESLLLVKAMPRSVVKACINGSYIYNADFENRKMISPFQKRISGTVIFTKESQHKKRKHP